MESGDKERSIVPGRGQVYTTKRGEPTKRRVVKPKMRKRENSEEKTKTTRMSDRSTQEGGECIEAGE